MSVECASFGMTAEQRPKLEKITRSVKRSFRLVRQAQALLMVADGVANAEIAQARTEGLTLARGDQPGHLLETQGVGVLSIRDRGHRGRTEGVRAPRPRGRASLPELAGWVQIHANFDELPDDVAAAFRGEHA